MQYRKMEKTGDMLSVLGYGCMRFPTKLGQSINEKKAASQIYYAIDNGVNYFDTAFPYHGGQSESFLGKTLKNGYRQKVKIATKLPPWNVKTREDMDRILDIQLQKLQTDVIDYYLIHALRKDSWDKMKKLDIFDFIEKAKEKGKIINIGFSFHDVPESFEGIVDDYNWDFTQIQYNLIDKDKQAGEKGLKYAAAKGLGIIIMEPLKGGNLAKKVPEVEKVWKKAENKRTPVEWALRWLLDYPEINVVLSGMSTDEQVKENIMIANESKPSSLTKNETEVLEKARDAYLKAFKIGCTGCQYCMPCPAGVNIPQCFDLYNHKHAFKEKAFARVQYINLLSNELIGGGGGEKHYASKCIECGKCEKACPQDLPIIDMLKQVKKEFEGFGMGFFKLIGKLVLIAPGKKAMRSKKS